MRAAGGGDGTAEAAAAPFPWEAALRFGLVRLRLDPFHFWRLTPRELAMLLDPGRPGAPGRAAFEALMARFPDDETRNRHD